MPDRPAAAMVGGSRPQVALPALGIGTWAWGDRATWGYGAGYGEQDLWLAYQAALASGINLFDTAEIYGRGRSERFLGEFRRRSGRSDVAIASKFAPLPWRLGRRSLIEALKRSLGRLGIDQVDLYQIHWPWSPVPPRVWVEGLADAVQLGLARAVGVSNYSLRATLKAHETLAGHGIPLTSNQVHYSLLQRGPERSGLLAACRERGITLIAYSPLEMGLLSGKYTPEHRPGGSRRRRYSAAYLAGIWPLIAQLRQIGETHGGKTPSQVALNWVIGKGALPIPGAKNAQQAEENAGALGWQLSPEEMAALDRLSGGAS